MSAVPSCTHCFGPVHTCWLVCRYKKLWDQDKDAYIRRYEKAQKPLSSYEADVTEYMNKEASDGSCRSHVHNLLNL